MALNEFGSKLSNYDTFICRRQKYQALCQELKDAKSILNNCSHALKKEKTDFRKLSYLNAKTEVKEIIDEIAELKIQICCSNEFESLNDIDKKIYELYFFENKSHGQIEAECNLSHGNLCRIIRRICFCYICDIYEANGC